MEIRVIGRGALAGLIAGVLGFVFARIFAEPVINKSIDYESGRVDILAALNTAAGRPVAPKGPEIFSRTIQSTVGIATGIIVFSVAMGALVAVAYLVLQGRFAVRPQTLAWLICGFGFLGVYLLPFVKYPANPPAIGHTFTIVTRGQLYLLMVAASLILLGLAVFVVGVGGVCRAPAVGAVRAVSGRAARCRRVFCPLWRAPCSPAVTGTPECEHRASRSVRVRPGRHGDSAADHQHLVHAAEG